ncbi:formylglycine-generating enzyme family protein [Luteolibacter marinus]|uniref:formylglycine-generating enzyme family protein n=1 Tax=Luteolibacter marinus TaxID=2776705 RepID=UPI001867F388|nr:SUMF1/EgtB/PvdO family nonheme iron enzyme [Luteolibacter marinus]
MKRLPLLAVVLLAGCKEDRPYPPDAQGKQLLMPAATPVALVVEPPPPPPVVVDSPAPAVDLAALERTRRMVVARDDSPPDAVSMMVYEEHVPGTKRGAIAMVPLAGGPFSPGSPDSEARRDRDEGPRPEIALGPFWISQFEITTGDYRIFTTEAAAADPRMPATGMSQDEASAFCEWLTSRTGHFYRLPTEAEWEFACRAGTTTAYAFGDNPSDLDDHAWTPANAGGTVHRTGTQRANPAGIHDMHGNVAEWCLDAYHPATYASWPSGAVDPWLPGDGKMPHVIRGGSFQSQGPHDLRSAARTSSSRPSPAIGFRIVRPLAIPSLEEMQQCWHSR